MSDPATVEIELTVKQGFLLDALVAGWTDEERAALDRGDEGALDALRDEAAYRARQAPHTVEVESFEIRRGGA